MAYRGISLPFPVGQTGFSGARNPSRLQPSHLSYVEGVDIDSDIIIRDRGASKLNTVSLGGAIIAGINWSPVAGEHHDVVMTDGGNVLRDAGTGAFSTTMKSGLTVPSDIPPFFVAGGGEDVGENRKLFLFSSTNQVQYADGDAAVMNPIGTPPADWSDSFPIFGVQHANRLWAGGNDSDPHRIYFSQIDPHTSFSGTGSGHLAIYPGEGDGLVGGVSFRGLLVLWKYPTGIYYVDTRDPNVANWSVNKITKSVGAVNPQTIFQIANDILYLDHGGNLHLLSATQELGETSTSNISQVADLGPFMRSNVNLSAIRKSVGTWFDAKAKAWIALPRTGEVENGLRVTIDFNNAEAGPRYFLSRRDIISAVWMRPGADKLLKPVIGDDAGFIWLMDSDNLNKGGEAYKFEFHTANTDFGYADLSLAYKAKSTAFLEVVADVETTATLSIKVFWDDVLTETLTMVLQPAGAGLGSFVLDTDVLGTSGTRSARQRMQGSGKRLKLIVENEELNQEIALTAFYVSFGITDERVTP
jgi:hypothetical protein